MKEMEFPEMPEIPAEVWEELARQREMMETMTGAAPRFCIQLGRELRQVREDAGLSRQQLSDRTGIHRNSIERYEAGADMPVMTFIRLCVAMGVSCPEILNRALS